ncbi:MAG: hypothetical protein NW201_10685 [Gemmatimonadales bacterium]|nr:hypothetical protein [Gemmatimonadales bacterium]
MALWAGFLALLVYRAASSPHTSKVLAVGATGMLLAALAVLQARRAAMRRRRPAP